MSSLIAFTPLPARAYVYPTLKDILSHPTPLPLTGRGENRRFSGGISWLSRPSYLYTCMCTPQLLLLPPFVIYDGYFR